MSKSIVKGVENVKRIVAEHKLPGVHGPLIELIACPEQCHTAVEVSGGTSLFSVVVDSDSTASKILDIMNRQRMGGRVTFLPLDRLRPSEPKFTDTETALALISRLHFQPRFRKAVLHVFGQTIICRDLGVASQLASEQNLNCITLEGDQVNRKGAMTGGYVDETQSKMQLQQTITDRRRKQDELRAEADAATKKAQALEQDMNILLSETEKIRSLQSQLRLSFKNIRVGLEGL